MLSLRKAHSRVRVSAVLKRYLRTGLRSTVEVRAYLRRRGISAADSKGLIDECLKSGALDDFACARLAASNLLERGYAWRAISGKLAAKGLSRDVIAKAEIECVHDNEDTARAFLADWLNKFGNNKLWSLTDECKARESARLKRAMLRRGHEQDQIEGLLNEYGLMNEQC